MIMCVSLMATAPLWADNSKVVICHGSRLWKMCSDSPNGSERIAMCFEHRSNFEKGLFVKLQKTAHSCIYK